MDNINILNVRFGSYNDLTDETIELTVKRKIGTSWYGPPDIVVVEIYDDMSKNYKFNKKKIISLFQNATYKLDGAIVRDTQMNHFCALLEIGKDECGFDGSSFRKLSKFKWKKHLGENIEWTFEGSNWNNVPGDPILWNFRSGYQLLFYYRV